MAVAELLKAKTQRRLSDSESLPYKSLMLKLNPVIQYGDQTYHVCCFYGIHFGVELLFPDIRPVGEVLNIQ
jgi:hypothetical protein